MLYDKKIDPPYNPNVVSQPFVLTVSLIQYIVQASLRLKVAHSVGFSVGWGIAQKTASEINRNPGTACHTIYRV